MDEPKVIYKYNGPINKYRQYNLLQKKLRRLKKDWRDSKNKGKEMLSVIGSLIGFASSTAPALADHFKQKNNQKFELEKMKTMAELRKAGFDHELKAFEAQAADKEHDTVDPA